MASPFYTAEHEAYREVVRRFVEKEIEPYAHEWDEAGGFPRVLYEKAAEIGLLGLGFPEEYGGTEVDNFMWIVAVQELARAGAGGVSASLKSNSIGAPPIARAGSSEFKARVLPEILSGKKISALAITEPGAGSDVARLACRARRDGADWVIDGEKAFITSGLRADWLTVAVRTGGPGASGISLVAVPGDAAGLERAPLAKMGWWCSDTARLSFTGCRVPAENVIGVENDGFRAIMDNFNGERLLMATSACAFATVCFDEALGWARQRKTFGQPLVEHQVVRHKLIDMRMRIFSAHAWIQAMIDRYDAGPLDGDAVAQLCLLKNHATQTMQFCADQAVQILGAMGFMRGTKSERIYREVKVMMIGGGSEEIMKELAARQLGL